MFPQARVVVADTSASKWSPPDWAIRNRREWFRNHLDRDIAVCFIVPAGFRGVFAIKEDCIAGAIPAWLSRQEVVYIIPESGVLLASQIFPLLTRHSTVAKVYGGDKFTCERPALTVCVLPIAPDLTFRYLIGTDCEYIQWMCDNAEQ